MHNNIYIYASIHVQYYNMHVYVCVYCIFQYIYIYVYMEIDIYGNRYGQPKYHQHHYPSITMSHNSFYNSAPNLAPPSK